MKLNGALKPHRADSNCWNDSFGGHYYNNNNNQFNKPNQQYQQNTNRNNQSFNNSNNNKQKPTICKRTPMDLFRCVCKRLAKNTRSAITSLKMMRIQQSPPSKSPFLFSSRRNFHYSALRSILLVLWVFTNRVLCDDNENGFFVNGYSLGPESTTAEFDYASRGSKKFGDKCESTLECGFPGSICDPRKKSCQCTEDLPVTNHIDKCGKEAAINETCFFNEQCEAFHFQTECRDSRCICRFEMSPIVNKDGNIECKGKQMNHEVERYVDPAMIGVLVGMALMFIIICVVLRLFSRARWRENRTIFNTPNPRLMNVSLLRDNKLLHGQERRGSRMSVRAPSRQPSMASLRPHSPNPSLGKAASSRPESRGSSDASATSTRSQRSNSAIAAHTTAAPTNTSNHHQHQHQHHHHHHHQQHNNSVNNIETKPENSNTNAHNKSLIVTNITENPAVDSVTVEIIEPKDS